MLLALRIQNRAWWGERRGGDVEGER